MESYQIWFGEGPELAILRMLGLFDRPADEKALGALLRPPVIRGLTESLTNLSQSEWRAILARLRRARLLAAEDPQNPGSLDAHPLVREYFGEQLRGERAETWKQCNKRLYDHYRTLAPDLPDNFREMEPLFLMARRPLTRPNESAGSLVFSHKKTGYCVAPGVFVCCCHLSRQRG